MSDATPARTEDWFGVEHLPRGRLRIRIWPGIEAVTDGVPDIQGRVRWYEVRGRNLQPLATSPKAWQPLTHTFTWPAGEPEPLPPSTLASLPAPATPPDTEAAALAAQMEEDREAARAQARAAPPATPAQWWRDASMIRYEPRGQVTPWHAEGRLMRALVTERAIRVGVMPVRSSAAALVPLQLLSELWAMDATEDWVAPVHPLPQDWADYLTVMGWLVELAPTRQAMRVLRARSRIPAYSWLQIGDAIDRDWTRARAVYRSTVAATVRAANGNPRRAAQRLRALQNRNQEARR